MKITGVSIKNELNIKVIEGLSEAFEFYVDYSIDEKTHRSTVFIESNANGELVSNIDDNPFFSQSQKEMIINAIFELYPRKPKRYTLLPFSKLNQRQKIIVNKVYEMLKDSEVYPSGYFEKANKFYADNSHLISCRAPSRAFPYSELNACRTKKYVAKVLQYYNCKSVKTLLKHI